MAGTEEPAAILRRDGARLPIARTDVVAAVKAGEVVLVPGALRQLGILDQIVAAILTAVREVAGPTQADALRRLGLERIHEVLDGAQLEAALHQSHARLQPRYPSFLKAIGVEALGLRRPFYAHAVQVLRFLAPHDVAARHAELFLQKKNLGRLDPHAPHRDHWFDVPLNAVNLWLAISAVAEDNGVTVFPDAWAAEVAQSGRYVRGDQLIGAPLRVACEAGDLLVFHGHHVHGAVLNTSRATRIAATMRLCSERPVAPSAAALDGGCLWSPLIGTRFEAYAATAARLSWIHLLERSKQTISAGVGALEKRVGGAPLRSLGRLTRRALRYRRGDSPPGRATVPRPLSVDDPAALADGQIAAIDDTRCAARIGGRVFVFGRRCPHEQADLAAGYVKDGRVHCPRHDYPIDPTTGRGPCETLAPLPLYAEGSVA